MKLSFFPIATVAGVAAVFAPADPMAVQAGWIEPAVAAEDAGDMAKVHLILKKLRDAMASMKDLDELEASGMPKKDVDRMRSAMQSKINQMMSDAMEDIRAL